jgi:hypothetical protein
MVATNRSTSHSSSILLVNEACSGLGSYHGRASLSEKEKRPWASISQSRALPHNSQTSAVAG